MKTRYVLILSFVSFALAAPVWPDNAWNGIKVEPPGLVPAGSNIPALLSSWTGVKVEFPGWVQAGSSFPVHLIGKGSCDMELKVGNAKFHAPQVPFGTVFQVPTTQAGGLSQNLAPGTYNIIPSPKNPAACPAGSNGTWSDKIVVMPPPVDISQLTISDSLMLYPGYATIKFNLTGTLPATPNWTCYVDTFLSGPESASQVGHLYGPQIGLTNHDFFVSTSGAYTITMKASDTLIPSSKCVGSKQKTLVVKVPPHDITPMVDGFLEPVVRPKFTTTPPPQPWNVNDTLQYHLKRYGAYQCRVDVNIAGPEQLFQPNRLLDQNTYVDFKLNKPGKYTITFTGAPNAAEAERCIGKSSSSFSLNHFMVDIGNKMSVPLTLQPVKP